MARRPGAGGIILLAVLLGMVTAWLIWSYARQQAELNEKSWQNVVVTSVSIPAKTKITEDMVHVEQYPKKLITEGMFLDKKDVINRTTKNGVTARAPLHGEDLLAPGTVPTLSFNVPEGYRGVAIAGDEVKFVGASVQPGDHIDIIATYFDTRTKVDVTRIILQDVLVLMVNRGETGDPNNNNGGNGQRQGALTSMTLAVKPDKTELVKAAERSGTMSVSLRSNKDSQIVQTGGVTPRGLASADQDDETPIVFTNMQNTAQAPVPQPPASFQPPAPRPSKEVDVKVIRGTEPERSYVVTPDK